MSRIRVIHVCLGLHLGGMEKLLVEFANHADRDQFDLQFISLTTKGAAAAEIERLGFEVIALNQRPGLSAGLPFRLARLFQTASAGVVHTHNTKALLYGAPAARLADVPVVVHTRHGQRLGATRRQTVLFNLAARCANSIVSVSHDSLQLAAAQGLPRQRLVSIHNGINLAAWTAVGPYPKGPVVFVGRFSAEKDIATLLRAAAIAGKVDRTFRLCLAGEGPDRAGLQALAGELGIANRTVFLGEMQYIAALLAGSSLLVLPSLSEGISVALLEAMARGLPVVATRVGGNIEVVSHGQTGLLVETRSPQALAEAMLTIYQNPPLARQMGEAGRQRVEEHFDARRMVAQYEALYMNHMKNNHCQMAA
jgi:glycosyltransferase involved in cell wall biosynthesis